MLTFTPQYRIATGCIPIVDSWRCETIEDEVHSEELEVTFELRRTAPNQS